MADGFTTLSAVLYIMNTMLGSGINFMPAAFNNSGIVFGFVILFIVGVLTDFSIYALFRCARKYEGEEILSYSNMAKGKSKYLKNTINAVMFVCSFFTGLGFQKYICEIFNVWISSYYPNKSPVFYRHLYVGILSVVTTVITGLSMIKNIGKLKFLSVLSVYCVCSLMAVLCILNISLSDFIANLPKDVYVKKDYPYSLSFFILAMSVQANIPDLYPKIINKSKKNLITIATAASTFGYLVYGLAGYLGYRLMGSCIGTSDILQKFLTRNSPLNVYLSNNTDLNPTYSSFLRFLTSYQGVCGAVILISGFPLQIMPATSFFKELIPFENPDSTYVHNTVVISQILVMSAINLIPALSLELLYGILGPSAVGFIAFLFPFFLYFLYRDKKSMIMNVFAWAIMLLSVGYCFFGIYSAIDAFLNPPDNITDFCFYNSTERLTITELN